MRRVQTGGAEYFDFGHEPQMLVTWILKNLLALFCSVWKSSACLAIGPWLSTSRFRRAELKQWPANQFLSTAYSLGKPPTVHDHTIHPIICICSTDWLWAPPRSWRRPCGNAQQASCSWWNPGPFWSIFLSSSVSLSRGHSWWWAGSYKQPFPSQAPTSMFLLYCRFSLRVEGWWHLFCTTCTFMTL